MHRDLRPRPHGCEDPSDASFKIRVGRMVVAQSLLVHCMKTGLHRYGARGGSRAPFVLFR